jgi:hypothetical protein
MGDSLTLAFNVAPTGMAYANSLSFSLSGALPPLTTVTFSPATVDAHAGSQRVVMTVHTQSLTRLQQSVPLRRAAGVGVVACGLWFLPLGTVRRRRASLMGGRTLCVMLVLTLFPTGCGGGYHDVTYPLVLSATDGTTTHSMPVTLHITSSKQ